MSESQADQDGQDILDDELLYRRIHPDEWIADKETGECRLSSSFLLIEPGMDGISAYAAGLLAEAGLAPAVVMQHPMHGLASLTAGDARELGFHVIKDANGELLINAAHILITAPTGDLSRGQRRKLSIALIRKTEVLKPPGR